ncbi:Uncharacterised protein [[Clostridium] sordellii]|uniref:hypothetical protein n=1 Tax=Paraclostridium sordellii TaxID=1505 RepID=UPI0005E5B90F|nr:hypothetical protein [Paeniclostridium sordellii]CEP46471.1 Uncharacterised protein [[Clostridium] sordellii] [Paeniclostridium sordellii]
MSDVKEIKQIEDKKIQNRKKIKSIILIIVIIISALFLLKSCTSSNIKNGTLVEGKVGFLPGLSKEEIEKMLQKQADASMFSFEINGEPVFKNGKSEGNIRIANPPYNTYNFKVTIKLDSTDEVILKTGMLKPKQYIDKAKLRKNLKKGNYKATAQFDAYDDNNKFQGKVLAALNIKILN